MSLLPVTVHRARIGTGEPFDAPDSQTLLQSALQAGVSLDSSCRNGTCRSCMCLVTSGRVLYRIAWPGLSADEKAQGFILPCVAYPASDVTMAPPEPMF